jgi:choline dehydrogenase
VVVGSRPGSAPVATRLALAGYSVLLVDAGGDHGTDRQVEVPVLHVLASEYDPIRRDYFVNHYANETQAVWDSKMTSLTPNGDLYSGLYPPEGSERLGVLYPRVGALGSCSQYNAYVTTMSNNDD